MYSKEVTYPEFITFAGLIGAGKTTLADKLALHLNAKVHHESVDTNDLLPLFYGDMSRWGFALQVSLLTQRHTQLQQINWDPHEIHVEDRFMDEDHVFATTLLKQGNMTQIEYDIYQNMVETYEKHVKRPDLIVFLDVSPEISLQRIRDRGRPMEQSIPVEYLKTLHREYQTFIKWISKRIPVVKITWEEYKETEHVAKLIMDRWTNKCFNITEYI